MGALTRAPVVMGDDPEVLLELRLLVRPEGAEPGEPRHQQQRRPLPRLLVVDVGFADHKLRHARLLLTRSRRGARASAFPHDVRRGADDLGVATFGVMTRVWAGKGEASSADWRPSDGGRPGRGDPGPTARRAGRTRMKGRRAQRNVGPRQGPPEASASVSAAAP